MHRQALPLPIIFVNCCGRTLRADVVLSFSGFTFVWSLFRFRIFCFIKAEVLRSTVPRYACTPAATRNNYMYVPSFVLFVFCFGLGDVAFSECSVSLPFPIFYTIISMESKLVLSFQIAFKEKCERI